MGWEKMEKMKGYLCRRVERNRTACWEMMVVCGVSLFHALARGDPKERDEGL
jgi:hypothetical protein